MIQNINLEGTQSVLNGNTISLYSKDSKEKIRIWQIYAEKDQYFQRSGLAKDGKLTEWVGVKCKPKNIGKTNGTTAEQQALSEMHNKIGVKLKEGYYYTQDEAINDTTFTPMLAHKYEDYADKLTWPMIAQPKFDGARCNVYIKNGEIVCRTRSNRDYVSVPHIIEQLKSVLEKYPTWVIDGELYNHDMRDNFEDLMSLIRQSKPTKDDLKKSKELIKLYIYDIYDTAKPNVANFGRLTWVSELCNDHTIVDSSTIHEEKDFESKLNYYLEQGYEGMMLRNPNGIYKPNGRSKDLLKCKIFQDAEFEIVEVLEGNGAWQGCAKKIIIRLENGKLCEASLKGTQEKLAKVLAHAKEYIGKKATVTFFGRTNGDLLRFPVVKDIDRHDV